MFNINTISSEIAENKPSFIDVAVSTLWIKPASSRPIDAPSTNHPVDLWKWTTSMTIDEKNWLIGKIQTQAPLGTPVTITAQQTDWSRILITNPKSQYSGWVPSKQLTYTSTFAQKESGPFVLITKPTAILYTTPLLDTNYMEISFNTRLPLLNKTSTYYMVILPNGSNAWIRKEDGVSYNITQDIPKPTGEKLINTASQFVGLPYLWAGVSGFGFDCSGFTSTIYQAYGIYLPRISAQQGLIGTPVKREELQKGDLIFFAYQNGIGSIHHVAIYYGDGKMIHSPNARKKVEIIPLETRGYIEEYAGARRYI